MCFKWLFLTCPCALDGIIMAEGESNSEPKKGEQLSVLEAAERVPFLLANDTTISYGQERVSVPIEATSGDIGERTMFLPKTPAQPLSWKPDSQAMQMMLEMGITENAARRALYNTGNESAELAAGWVFDNLHLVNINDPFIPYAHPPSPGASTEPLPGAATNADQQLFSSLQITSWKMVFVVNTELHMGVGKIAAQVGHATLGLYKQAKSEKLTNDLTQWETNGATKIVLNGSNTTNLLDIQREASAANLACYVVHDAGKTQVLPGAITVLGVFGHSSIVDRITGSFKLL